MHKTVVITLSMLTLIVLNASAQNEKFTGVGIFKIGTDTSVLLKYANSHIDFVWDCKTSDEFTSRTMSDTSVLLRLKRDKDPTMEVAGLSHNPFVTEYFLSTYEISGITISYIRLKYFKNRLIEFRSWDSHELGDALKEKYGKPVIKITVQKSKCLYKLTGIERPLEAKTFTLTWTNGNISAIELLWDKFDSHCEISSNSLFYYSIKNQELDNWEHIHRFDEIKKRNLKDF